MFIAKFTKTSSAPFKQDKNGNFPLIGTVVAGAHSGSIINGTIATRENIEENTLYLCDNSVDPEYPENVNTTVVSKVSVLELMSMRTQLGAPRAVKFNTAKVVEETVTA